MMRRWTKIAVMGILGLAILAAVVRGEIDERSILGEELAILKQYEPVIVEEIELPPLEEIEIEPPAEDGQ